MRCFYEYQNSIPDLDIGDDGDDDDGGDDDDDDDDDDDGDPCGQ